jgi:hypothetical protein
MTDTSTMCAKTAFASEAEAMKRLFEIALVDRPRHRGPKPHRCYFCRDCFNWHLTRRPM